MPPTSGIAVAESQDGATIETREDSLTGLAKALSALAARLRARAEAARDFTQLKERAKSIAARAWDARTSKWAFTENAQKLAADLNAFAHDVAAASERASSEIEGSTVVVDALVGMAERITSLGQSSRGSTFHAALRQEMKPLEATLQALRVRVYMVNSVSDDAANLAQQARNLAVCARSLRGGGRDAEEAVAIISSALNSFADDANTISTRMMATFTGLSEAAARMASGANEVKQRLGSGGIKQAGLSGVAWG